MYTFRVVTYQSNTFFDYFVCSFMGSSTTDSTWSYLYTLYRNFLIIRPYDLELSFISKKTKNIKVNVLGLVEVLQKCQTRDIKVNHETTPPYLRDQFTTCNLFPFVPDIVCRDL